MSAVFARLGLLVLLASAALAGPPVENWVVHYNRVNHDDEALALAVDAAGNSCVAGRSWGPGNDPAILIVKYDSAGGETWTVRYDEDGNDVPAAIAVDPDGNVHVTGQAGQTTSGSDIITLKYSPSGQELWRARYAGPSGATDIAEDIALAPDGSVYIVGSSSVPNGNVCLVVRYRPDGSEAWARRFSPRDSSWNYGRAVTADADGAFVAGASDGSYLVMRCLTNGDTAWTRHHSGGGQGDARAIVPDGSGVVVTGQLVTSGSDLDYVTVRFSSTGERDWTAVYDGPAHSHDQAYAICRDSAGGIYVAGRCQTSLRNVDYATVKYSASGSQRWVAYYSGPDTAGTDIARAAAADRFGRVCVTGQSWSDTRVEDFDYATVCYDSGGTRLWTHRYSGAGGGRDEAVCLDFSESGRAVVSGRSQGASGDFDFVTVALDTGGGESWLATYAGPGGPGTSGEDAHAIGRDRSGNLFVSGEDALDVITVKYDAGGNELWQRVYDGSSRGTDDWMGMTTSEDGDIRILARSQETRPVPLTTAYAVIRYDPDGGERWVTKYFGPDSAGADPVALCADRSGNSYVTGGVLDTFTVAWHTVKFDSTGARRWIAVMSRTDTLQRYSNPRCIAVDDNGYVYVGGEQDSLSGFEDMLLIRYDPEGNEDWRARYAGPGRGVDLLQCLVVDADGSAYACGQSWDSVTGYDYAIVRFTPAGETAWVRRYAGPGGLNNEDIPRAVALDDSGNVLVTGSSWADSSMDYLTVKYAPDGQQLWTARYDGSGRHTDVPTAVAADRLGNIYVTGYAWQQGTLWDYTTVMYSAGGEERWSLQYHGTGNYYDKSLGLVVEDSMHLWVTGASVAAGQSSDMVTIFYGPNPGLTATDAAFLNTRMVVRPGISTRKVGAMLFLPTGGAVRLGVYDRAGRLVRLLVADALPPGNHSFAWNCADQLGRLCPAGAYFIRAETPSGSTTGHVVVVR